MVVVNIRVKTGETFTAQLETLEQARELVANKPFIEIPYQDAFVIVNSSEVAFIAASTVRSDGSVDTGQVDLTSADS